MEIWDTSSYIQNIAKGCIIEDRCIWEEKDVSVKKWMYRDGDGNA